MYSQFKRVSLFSLPVLPHASLPRPVRSVTVAAPRLLRSALVWKRLPSWALSVVSIAALLLNGQRLGNLLR